MVKLRCLPGGVEMCKVWSSGPTGVIRNHHQSGGGGDELLMQQGRLPCNPLWVAIGTREKIAKIKRIWKLKLEMVEND